MPMSRAASSDLTRGPSLTANLLSPEFGELHVRPRAAPSSEEPSTSGGLRSHIAEHRLGCILAPSSSASSMTPQKIIVKDLKSREVLGCSASHVVDGACCRPHGRGDTLVDVRRPGYAALVSLLDWGRAPLAQPVAAALAAPRP